MAQQFLDRAQIAAAGQRCVAKLWRSACGVAVSGRPSARAQRCHLALHEARVSGPPRAPTNSGPSGGSGYGQTAR